MAIRAQLSLAQLQGIKHWEHVFLVGCCEGGQVSVLVVRAEMGSGVQELSGLGLSNSSRGECCAECGLRMCGWKLRCWQQDLPGTNHLLQGCCSQAVLPGAETRV